MKSLKTWIAVGLGGAGMLLAAGLHAMPVFDNGNIEIYLKQNTFPSGLEEEKIFLNAGTGTTVTGQVGSQTGMPTVNFTSSTSLDAANGFATIKGENNALFHDLEVTVPGYFFDDLIFKLNLVQQIEEDVKISAFRGNTLLAEYDGLTSDADWGNGENAILVLALNNASSMTRLLIESVNGMLSVDAVDQAKQFEISNVRAVPVPAAVWLMGSAIIGLIGFRRRNQA